MSTARATLHTAHPAVARVAVWLVLGLGSWAVVASVLIAALRIVR